MMIQRSSRDIVVATAILVMMDSILSSLCSHLWRGVGQKRDIISTTTVHALDPTLLSRAATLRNELSFKSDIPTDASTLYYPSSYKIYHRVVATGRSKKKLQTRWSWSFGSDDDVIDSAINREEDYYMRGFCNWILPQRLMVGQYPGQTPEKYGPTLTDVQGHLQSLIEDAGITAFCSLQDELPPQSDYDAWAKVGGEVYLADDYWRRQFPNPFKHYAPSVDDISSSPSKPIEYWHSPIEDLSVPKDSKDLQDLLSKMLDYLLQDTSNCIYLHCWGGRERAGLVSACLLALIYPEIDDPNIILNWIQTGYDSRLGADQMPRELSKSPQTESQRLFVRKFMKERPKPKRKR